MPGAGNLRDRVEIRRQTNVKNPSTGGLTRSWASVATVWAQVRAINGREAIIGSTLQGISTFEIIIRYRDDLKAADQILWDGRELNIVAPPEDRYGTRKWTQILASTLAPQGA
jgi:SPP1 family predicted phage head-tail adaptor